MLKLKRLAPKKPSESTQNALDIHNTLQAYRKQSTNENSMLTEPLANLLLELSKQKIEFLSDEWKNNFKLEMLEVSKKLTNGSVYIGPKTNKSAQYNIKLDPALTNLNYHILRLLICTTYPNSKQITISESYNIRGLIDTMSEHYNELYNVYMKTVTSKNKIFYFK